MSTTDTVSNNKRIAKNTMYMYFRMLITLAVGLYTSRVVLQVLGVSDYGLYNVVGGFVTMFTFLNATMSAGTQRFLSYSIGENNQEKLDRIFSNAVVIQVCISCIILLLLETVGLWFLRNKMNIPADRMDAAFWVYQFSIASAVVQVMQVPFQSSIIAHERMSVYAYLSIYDALAKLGILYAIRVIPADKLILYGAFMLLVFLSTAVIYFLYARRFFPECRSKIHLDKPTFIEMISFSGWTTVGMLGTTLQGQGVNVLLNMFFGTVINAARGIAFQVNNMLLLFGYNFQTAINPQIIKYYANGEIAQMSRLVMYASKFSSYLLLILMMPLFINGEYLLDLWLGDYPSEAVVFMKLICIQSLLQIMVRPVIIVTHASGKVKMPNLTGGLCVCLAIPLCWAAHAFGAGPYTVMGVSIVPWVFEEFFDLYYAWKFAGFPMTEFYKNVYFRTIGMGMIVYFIVNAICRSISKDTFLGLIAIVAVSTAISLLLFFYGGFNKDERNKIVGLIKSKIKL